MTKNKRPILKMNGEKLKETKSPSIKMNVIEDNSEQAATVDKLEQTKKPLAYSKKASLQSIKNKFNQHNSVYKKMGIAVVIATIIGSILGFVMLNVFSSIGSGVSSSKDSATIALQEDEEEKSDQAITLQEQKAYVLQGGVFEEKKNAEALLNKLQSNQVQAMIWERGGEYSVLAGISPTIKHAEQSANEIKEKKEAVFIKEWTTNAATVELSEPEMEWLESFGHLLTDAIQATENKTSGLDAEWKELIQHAPDKTTKLMPLIDVIKHAINDGNTPEKLSASLLTIWYEYEKVLMNLS